MQAWFSNDVEEEEIIDIHIKTQCTNDYRQRKNTVLALVHNFYWGLLASSVSLFPKINLYNTGNVVIRMIPMAIASM
jgi:hypothetical protein